MRIKRKYLNLLFISALLLFQNSVATATSGMTDKQREQLLEIVKAQHAGLAEDALALWDLAELGFMETQSVALLQERLRNAGFTITSGIAGMPTAFVARFSTGSGPVIGILAEYDALPGLSQAATTVRQEIAGKNTAHGCGHNLLGAASTASAIALKQWLEKSGTKGEVRLYGCPAEEGGGAKVYMARDGVFDGVDAVLHWHPTDYNGYHTSPHMAILTGQFTFRGVSSHASASPDRGRSALDGAQIMSMAVEYLREHIPDRTRIHYIISSGGETPNVVPDYATIHLTVRHNDTEVVKQVWERILGAARGAAIATGTTSECEIINGMHPLLINRTLMDVAIRNFEAVHIPAWNDNQMAFAEGIARSLPEPGKLDPSIINPAYPVTDVMASTDVGDVSWVVPTVGIFSMSWIPGTAAHSWQAVAANGSSLGVQGACVASEVMATTAAELFLNPETLEAAKKEMAESLGDNFVYKSLIGDREPPLDYQKAFAGEIKK